VPPTVLIAEDSEKMRDLLVVQLRSLGIEAATAKTGLEALAQTARLRPDLILLDGLLPEMHGFEVARAIRQLDRDYHPHIAIITGVYKGTQYQNDARLKYGIDDYLLKPITTDTLRNLIGRVR
jgi:CheY-like chemotaxis protein